MKLRSAARRRSLRVALGGWLAFALHAVPCASQDATPSHEDNAAFLYREPMPTDYLRPMVEELAALLLGLGATGLGMAGGIVLASWLTATMPKDPPTNTSTSLAGALVMPLLQPVEGGFVFGAIGAL